MLVKKCRENTAEDDNQPHYCQSCPFPAKVISGSFRPERRFIHVFYALSTSASTTFFIRFSILAGKWRRTLRRGVGLPRPKRAIRRAGQAHAPTEIARKYGESFIIQINAPTPDRLFKTI